MTFSKGYIINNGGGKAVLADMRETSVMVGKEMHQTLRSLEATYRK